jgi:Uma2 family endonuclease
MFVVRDKLEQFRSTIPDADDKPYVLVPDIAVEIVSPNDAYSEIAVKVRRYLKDGVQLVWVVDPQVREVAVHEAGKQSPTILGDEDTLHADSILSGFSLPVRTIFGATS